MPLSRVVLALSLAVVWFQPTMVRSEEADDQYAVAAAHYARQQWDLATEAFEEFLERWPQHAQSPASVFFLGESLIQQGNYEAARTRFDQSLAREPEGRFARQSLFRAGEAAYLLRDYDTAEDRLRNFVEQYPDDALNAYALPYLAQIDLEADHAEKARKQFATALERFPSGALANDCRLGLARALTAVGQTDEATKLYRELATDAGNVLAADALFQWAAQSYAAGDHAAARQRFAELLDRFPQDPLRDKARLGQGWAEFHLQDFEAAEATFRQLVDSTQVGTEAEYWLGLTYKSEEKWEQAAETLQRSAQNDGTWQIAARYHAAETLAQLHRAEEAAQLFKVVADQRENEWADDALVALARGAFETEEHLAVDQLAKRLVVQHANSPLRNEMDGIRARSLLRRKEYDAAVELLEAIPSRTASTPAPGDKDSNQGTSHDQALSESSETLSQWNNRYLLAVAYEEQGKSKRALALIEPLLEAAPDNEQLRMLQANGHALKARVSVERSDYEAALGSLRHYLAAQPEGEFAIHAAAQLAICQARTNAWETAKRTFDAWRAKAPPADLLSSTIQQMAEAAFVAGDLTWAAERFAELTTAEQPDRYRKAGLSGLAWCHFDGKQFVEAAKRFDELLDRFPDSDLAIDAALARGEIFEQQQQLDAALAMYQQTIDRDDVDADQLRKALIRAARLHDQLQRDREAAVLFARLAGDYPEDPQRDEFVYQWAWVLVETGDEAAAAERFAELVKRYPESSHHADATLWLARRAYDRSQFEHAAQLVDELASSQTPQTNLDQALYLRGQIAAALGQWQDVSRPFQRLIAEVPESPLRLEAEYWLAEATFHLAKDDPSATAVFEESRRRFSQLVEDIGDRREPWMAMVSLRRAQLAAHQDQWAEVLAIAETIAEQFPAFAQQHEVDYLVGRAMASQARFEEARQAYHRVIHSKTGGKTETAAIAQWMIGEAYFHQQNYATALREYLRLEILYDYPTWQSAALLQAGKCHEMLGEWKKAGESYRRILAKYPQTEFADDATGRLKKIRSRVARRP